MGGVWAMVLLLGAMPVAAVGEALSLEGPTVESAARAQEPVQFKAQRTLAAAFTKGSWMGDVFGVAMAGVDGADGDATFTGGGVGASYYLWDDFAMRGELIGLHVAQHGDDAAAGGLNLFTRWHFLHRERFTLFAEIGGGLLQADVSIPDDDRSRGDDGTNFCFTAHGGLGATYQLTDRTHVFGAFRYLHLSNARLEGAERNPSEEAIGGYMGLMVAF